MSTLRTLKKLVLGETWLLPLGITLIISGSGLLLRPLLGGAWDRLGGFVLLASVVVVLLASVACDARGR